MTIFSLISHKIKQKLVPARNLKRSKPDPEKNMAMENFSSNSHQKRSWTESEDYLTTESAPNNSSTGQDDVNINKKLRIQPEAGDATVNVDSTSETKFQGLKISHYELNKDFFRVRSYTGFSEL